MCNLINKVKNLPNGIRRNVYNYIQHDVAIIVTDAINNNKMKLKYLKNRTIRYPYNYLSTSHWLREAAVLHDNYYGSLIYIIESHLLELRPSQLKQKMYGEGTIERTNLSVGELVRLRRQGVW
tara:strand:+ start:1674 stop:2042 length:369 start_codon:yes stop_codon:yes gene_type:complete